VLFFGPAVATRATILCIEIKVVRSGAFWAESDRFGGSIFLTNYLTSNYSMVSYDFAYPNHVIFDLYGVDPGKANDLQSIIRLARSLAQKLRSDIVGEVYHTFEPQGVIYVATLLQSHIAVF
jgi:hypothetical protein